MQPRNVEAAEPLARTLRPTTIGPRVRWVAACGLTALIGAVVAGGDVGVLAALIGPSTGPGELASLWSEHSVPEVSDDIEMLLGRLGSPHSESVVAVGHRLSRLGRNATPALLDRLEGVRTTRGQTRAVALLTHDEEEAILVGLSSSGATGIRSAVTQRLAERPVSVDARVAVFKVLGRVATRNQLDLLEAAADCTDESGGMDQRVRAALEAAIVEILERDPDLHDEVGHFAQGVPADLAWTYVRAIGRAESVQGIEVLSRLLDLEDEILIVVVAELGRVGEAFPYAVSSHTKGAIQRLLVDRGDPQRLREAIQTLGKLEDFDSIPALIELLAHERSPVRDAAAWSLARTSGMGRPLSVLEWHAWLNRERSWFDENAESLFESLRAQGAGEMAAALNSLAVRRYRRDEIAAEVEDLLFHPSTLARLQACAALTQLGSRTSIPALVSSLSDADDSVRSAAWGGLRSITGLDLPADRAAWEERYPAADGGW